MMTPAAFIAFLMANGIDENLCYFFENGWEERITRAAEEPFKAYLKRNPPKKRTGPSENHQ